MSLINCPECGREISDTLSNCIHCGYQLKEDFSQNEQIQQVEVTAIKFNKKRIKKICIIASIWMIIFAVGFGIFLFIENKNNEASKTEYVKTMKNLSTSALDGAVKSEELCNLTKSVWYNCIYEEDDSETDKYTKVTDSIFHSDFNTALSNLFTDQSTKDAISYIKVNQELTKELFKELKEVPDGYEEYYKACNELYEAYKDFTNLAIDPSGNLKSFSEKFSELDTECIEAYRELVDLIEELALEK